MVTRIFFILLFSIGAYLVWAQRYCLSVRFSQTPQQITRALQDHEQKTAVFLFGPGLCNVCPTGERIQLLRDKGFLFVFEEEITDGEIANFMETYQVLGTPVRADTRVERYLRAISECYREKHWRRNLIAEFSTSGKLLSLREL